MTNERWLSRILKAVVKLNEVTNGKCERIIQVIHETLDEWRD